MKHKQEIADAELLIMSHRYLYYVLANPVIPDVIYDELERNARAICPETSVVHRVGSSLPSSYSTKIINSANRILAGHREIA